MVWLGTTQANPPRSFCVPVSRTGPLAFSLEDPGTHAEPGSARFVLPIHATFRSLKFFNGAITRRYTQCGAAATPVA